MEIPVWNLDQLYPSGGPELEADLAALKDQTRKFTAWRARLQSGPPSPLEFRELVTELAALNRLAHRLSGFAHLAFAQDTQDQKAQVLMARMNEEMADLGNELLFFEIWWKELDGEIAAPLASALPDFAYWLERTRAFRPHTLPEP